MLIPKGTKNVFTMSSLDHKHIYPEDTLLLYNQDVPYPIIIFPCNYYVHIVPGIQVPASCIDTVSYISSIIYHANCIKDQVMSCLSSVTNDKYHIHKSYMSSSINYFIIMHVIIWRGPECNIHRCKFTIAYYGFICILYQLV